jgi:hypothetical protein
MKILKKYLIFGDVFFFSLRYSFTLNRKDISGIFVICNIFDFRKYFCDRNY